MLEGVGISLIYIFYYVMQRIYQLYLVVIALSSMVVLFLHASCLLLSCYFEH